MVKEVEKEVTGDKSWRDKPGQNLKYLTRVACRVWST